MTAQLSGTYTIGTNGNYSSFTSAVSALTTSGINGPIVFYVDSGTYNEQITIPAITGTSSSNTISFIGLSGDSTDAVITYAPTSNTNNFTVKLNNTSFIKFSNITISSTGNTMYSNVIVFGNVCSNIEISNCNIVGTQNSNSSNLINSQT